MLLDRKLPKLNGFEELEQVRTDDNLKMIPVVVLTSSHEERDLVKSYTLGVNAYVVKPVDFHQFVMRERVESSAADERAAPQVHQKR